MLVRISSAPLLGVAESACAYSQCAPHTGAPRTVAQRTRKRQPTSPGSAGDGIQLAALTASTRVDFNLGMARYAEVLHN